MTASSTADEGIHWSARVRMAGCLLWASMEAEMSISALAAPCAPIDFTRFLPTKFTPPAPATPPTQIISLMSSQRELPLSPKSTRKLNAQRKVQPLTTRIYQLSSLTHKSRTGRLPGKSTTSSPASSANTCENRGRDGRPWAWETRRRWPEGSNMGVRPVNQA